MHSNYVWYNQFDMLKLYEMIKQKRGCRNEIL